MSSSAAHIQRFDVHVPDDRLMDLQRRLSRSRLPATELEGWEAGTSPGYLRELCDYWRWRFDWRAQETRINRFAHFRAIVAGRKLHFIHERGRGPHPLPIVLTHGFPDSFLRFSKRSTSWCRACPAMASRTNRTSQALPSILPIAGTS
jgi:hypothetical protein